MLNVLKSIPKKLWLFAGITVLIIGIMALYPIAQSVIAEGLNAREVKQVDEWITEASEQYTDLGAIADILLADYNAKVTALKAELDLKLDGIRTQKIELNRKANAWRDYKDFLSGKN